MNQDELIEQKENTEVVNDNPEAVEVDNKAQIALAQAQFAEALALCNQLSKKSKSHTQEVNELFTQVLELNTEVDTYITPKK